MKGIACKDCRYAAELIAGKIYNCRVDPPVRDEGLSWECGNGVWPTVEATDWCGRWAPKEKGLTVDNPINPETQPPPPPTSA